MKHAIGLLAAMLDENLFGKVFATPSMWTWRVVAKLVDGLPLVEERERQLFFECTGIPYNRHNRRAVRRLILLCGRRAGKDRFLSAVAIWRAALCADWRKHISPGEQAVVILLGADKKQGNILSKYCGGLLEPAMLRAEVTRHIKDIIEFRNGSSLEISTNDARLIRGRSAIALLGSECCHWKTAEYSESSDEEVVGAAEPSLSMCPDGGMIVLGSSVYRKKGYMYRQWKQKWGQDDADTLVWMAPSARMNPRLPQHIIDTALATDSARAKAEYMCEWRSDLSDFIPHDVVEAATDFGVYERAPVPNVQYFSHADAAGGTGTDSFAFSISHRDTSYVVDVVREFKPRFTPAAVIAELAALLATYGITKVHGDKYAIGFHSAEWKAYGIEFVPCEKTTSENYLTVLPLMLAGRVRLVDNKTLRHQLGALERKPGEFAREQVSHPAHANAHDDVACAVAGSIVATMPGDGTYPLETWQRAFNPESLDPLGTVRRYQPANGTSAALIPYDMRMQAERAAVRAPAPLPIAPTHEEITRNICANEIGGKAMIDVSISTWRTRVRADPYAPLEFPEPGPPRDAGKALLSDSQTSFLGNWVSTHLPARQRDDFRRSVIGKLSAGRPGGAAFSRAVVLTALEFGFQRDRLADVGLCYTQERADLSKTRARAALKDDD